MQTYDYRSLTPEVETLTTASLAGSQTLPVSEPATQGIRVFAEMTRRSTMRIRRGLAAHRRRVRVLQIVWAAALLVVVAVPLLLSLVAGGRGDLMIELSLTTGLLAFSALTAVIVLPSRVRSLTLAFGIERVLRSHRWLALAGTALVLIHLVFVVLDKPSNLQLLYPPSAPPRARAATAATVALVLMVLLTLFRRRLRTRYDIWRAMHAFLAMVVLVGSALHVFWLNHLMQDRSMRLCFELTGLFLVVLLANRWVVRPWRNARRPFVVAGVREEVPGVRTVSLVPQDPADPGLRFRPGQFAWIRFDSPWGPLKSNPFSIASGAHEPRRLEFTIREVGDFTGSLGTVRPGRKVYLDGPYGSFNDDHERSPGLLLIAGGVGITPMISMVRTLAARGDDRPICLVVGARTPQDLMFRSELAQLSTQLDLDVVEVVSQPDAAWVGDTGRIDAELLAAVLGGRRGRSGAHAYICGPSQMITDVHHALLDLGLPGGRVHTEQFDMV